MAHTGPEVERATARLTSTKDRPRSRRKQTPSRARRASPSDANGDTMNAGQIQTRLVGAESSLNRAPRTQEASNRLRPPTEPDRPRLADGLELRNSSITTAWPGCPGSSRAASPRHQLELSRTRRRGTCGSQVHAQLDAQAFGAALEAPNRPSNYPQRTAQANSSSDNKQRAKPSGPSRAGPEVSETQIARDYATQTPNLVNKENEFEFENSNSEPKPPGRAPTARSFRPALPGGLAWPLLAICVIVAAGSGRLGAYQLTNNLVANNSAPKFVTNSAGGGTEIVVRVKEGAHSIGRLICSLRGEDADEDPLTFGLLGQTAHELVRVENVQGKNAANVYLRKELDREAADSHQLVVTLTDGKLGRGNWITKSMLIIVEDINDNYPVFAPHKSSVSIREDSAWPLVIETLEASDADEGRFGQLIYRLDADEHPPGHAHPAAAEAALGATFAVDTIDGRAVVSLVGGLDYELKSSYELRVVAVDRAAEPERLATSTSLLVNVEDVDDQPPVFAHVPSITRIPENLPLGHPVTRVLAVDGDRGVNAPISYALAAVNGAPPGALGRQPFDIDARTGQIRVAAPLDRESDLWASPASAAASSAASGGASRPSGQPGSYVLQVRATEESAATGSGDNERSSTTELTIILTDVNDEPPTFNKHQYWGEILENSPADTLVALVDPQLGATAASAAAARVHDRDQGTNGTFTLRLEGEHAHLFEVWPREATNEANFMLKLSSLINYANSDARLSGSDAIDMVSGDEDSRDRIAQLLDFERNKQLRFEIVASEKYPSTWNDQPEVVASSRAQVVVSVRDANDNYPQFERDLYRVEIPENAMKGMHICQVRATDADSGALGSAGIRYTELRGDKAAKFALDPISGIVSLKSQEHGFDRELHPQHQLTVEARDSNGLGNRNSTQLLIVIADVNDQAPKFALDKYEASIYENEPDFVVPLQVQAVDLDAPNGPNSRLTYAIVGGEWHQNFTIDAHTGRVQLKAPTSGLTRDAAGQQAQGLDFERIRPSPSGSATPPKRLDDPRLINITVRATDAGLPEPMSAETQLLISVHDRNDHAPVFSRQVYARSLREDAREGTPVVQVFATDGDQSAANSRISYRLASGASDKFVIDSESGWISVANGANLDIDRGASKRTHHLLGVVALDGAPGASQKSAQALVNVTVTDVNNKPPDFVSLGASAGDASSAMASVLQASPRVLGLDTPTQAPVVVNEDAPFGLIVTRVVAHDPDSNAKLRYSIQWSRSEARNEDMQVVDVAQFRDCFSIDAQDGLVKVARHLDRELFDQVKLRLQVEDTAADLSASAGAFVEQVAFANLLIRVGDVNDNRPEFKAPQYKAIVNENSIGGTSIVTVAADDRDLNKTMRYSLEGPAEMLRLVRINPKSGEVTVNDRIDRETTPTINITVRAEDSGLPHPLSGTAQLIISVRDENDNNPVFVSNATTTTTSTTSGSASGPLLAPGASVWVREDAPVGTPVGFVRAEDVDIGPNGRVTYLLDAASSGSAKFRVDRDSGAIVVAGQLDREQSARYSLIIEACDNYELGYSTGESRRVFTQLTVMLGDVNDNSPQITSLSNYNTNKLQALELAGAAPETSQAMAPARYAHPSSSSSAPMHPTYDELLASPGPYEVPMPDCIAISEFQAPNEPIGTLMATDLDDPATPNGQVEVAIISQQSLFSLRLDPNHRLRASTGSSSSQEGPASGYHHQLGTPSTFTSTFTSTTSSRQDSEREAVVSSTQANPPSSSTDFVVAVDTRDETFETASSTSQAPKPNYRESSEASAPSGTLSRRAELDSDSESSKPSGFGSSENEPARMKRQASLHQFASIYTSRDSSSPRNSAPTSRQPKQGHNEPHNPSVDPRGLAKASSRLTDPPGASTSVQYEIISMESLRDRVGNYSVLVRATDRGDPSLSSIKVINICVLDINDHSPVFTRPPLNYTIRIQENSTLGSYVTQVEASDSDHGLNGQVQYSLRATNNNINAMDSQWFRLDRQSGVITTARLFNRAIKRHYSLRVQAQDLGRPTSLSSDIDINIMIVNSGSYQPEFAESNLQLANFTENVAPQLEFVQLVATANLDDDPALINNNSNSTIPSNSSSGSSSNGSSGQWKLPQPCYFVVGGDDHEQAFRLDRYTHRLTNLRMLDREHKANYTLIVKASNSCQPPSESSTSGQPQAQAQSSGQSTLTKRSALGAQVQSWRQPQQPIASHSKPTTETPAKSARHIHVQPALAPNKRGDTGNSGSPTSFAPANYDALVAADKSLLKLFIRVLDVNDNSPKFTQKVYTGGITTETEFGTVFMIVQAFDADAEPNNQVTYSIVKPIRRQLVVNNENLNDLVQAQPGVSGSSTMTSHSGKPSSANLVQSPQSSADGATTQTYHHVAKRITKRATPPSSSSRMLPVSIPTLAAPTTNPIGSSLDSNQLGGDLSSGEGDDLFVINAQTGELSLNFDPQRHMKGYFEFDIMARDPDGFSDSSTVYIYLLRQDQRVKFVLRLAPVELRQRLNKFRSLLGNITGAIVNVDSFKYYETPEGTTDKKKTSLYLHFVNPDDNSIIEVDKVLTLIDNNIDYLDELYKEFHVLSSEAAHMPMSQSALIDPMDQVRNGLLGATSFLMLILLLVVALCLNQRSRYERQLKAATVSAFGASPLHLDPEYQRQSSLPNTNLHSQDPNPIWVNGVYGSEALVGGGNNNNPRVAATTSEWIQNNGRNNHGPNKTMLANDIETDGDYLSHSAHSSELNSLGNLTNAMGNMQSSSANSSTSTTNERQTLFSDSQTTARPSTGVTQTASSMAAAASNVNTGRSSQHQSTFGAFKEVTIYTDASSQPIQFEHNSTSALASNITSQVTKIASQINARNQQMQQQQPSSQHQQQQQLAKNGSPQNHYHGQRIVVQSTQTPNNQASKSQPQQQHLDSSQFMSQHLHDGSKNYPNNKTTLNVNLNSNADYFKQKSLAIGSEAPPLSALVDDLDTNLNNLKILNLETTEL